MTVIKDEPLPPPYSAIPSIDSADASAAERYSASSSQAQTAAVPFVNEASLPGAPFTQQQQHRVQYGPTPIPQQLQQGTLLPYYDPQSPYAMQQAISRARWRFIGAFLWAVGIYVAFGIVTGGIVIDFRRSS